MRSHAGTSPPSSARRLRTAVLCLALALAAGIGPAIAAPAARAFVKHPQPVPILVYHHVQSTKAGYYLMYVGTSQFAGQLQYLHHNGYHPITLGQVWDAWMGRSKLPRRPVVLSFDDGYVDQYSNAARLLRRYHYPAVLNLVVHSGTALSRAMVRRMIAWGWEVDSHTLTHPLLTHLSSSQLRHQLVGSKRILMHRYHVPVEFLCYPGGIYDSRVMRAVRAAGYAGATSIRYGRATPRGRFAMPRIAAYWGESLGTFGNRMRTAPRMSPVLGSRELGLRRAALAVSPSP